MHRVHVHVMGKFNTAGPIRPARDYNIPPLERLNRPQVRELIRDERYRGRRRAK